jgi:glycerol-3-phosphate acyltransferase PlsY
MGYVIVLAVAYLMGSSNLAYFLSKLKKVDLKADGSGNLGASNATILLGWWSGILVGAHDIGKAVLAVLLAEWIFPDLPYIGAVAGVASVMGHIFPFYLKFKGGKGFASFLGMTLALNWKLALVIMAVVVIVTVITDYIVIGTATTVITVPVAEGLLTRSFIVALILLVATGVILYKHRENFVRIRNRTEFGLKSAIRGDKRVKK